jgi:hypothetical protein
MRGGSPTPTLLSQLQIDALKDWANFAISGLGSLTFGTDARTIRTPNIDSNAYLLMARDSGVGYVEIARVQGAADPYLQATLPMVLLPAAIPGSLVEGHFGYDSATDRLWFRDAAVTSIVPKMLSSSYVGDDTDNRQITTGFPCRLVIVHLATGGAMWICIKDDSCIYLPNGAAINNRADVILHASDGFIVDHVDANHTGVTFKYVAIG